MPPRPSVPFRHIAWSFLALAIPLCAANPSLTVQISTETAPPGGYAQFKVFATPPALIAAASITLNLDPAIFGPISSINAFSATGDQIGSLQGTINLQTGASEQATYVTSASASLGQLPDLPIFIVTVPVLATAKIGTTSPITADSTVFPWKDRNQNTYTVTVNPGTFTVGGTLSIQSVTPGAGLLPTGAVVTIDGTGFDATATVTIDGVSIASTELVSAEQLDVTLGGSTEMAGKHVHLSNAAGTSTDFFASLSNAQNLILPLMPALPFTAVVLGLPSPSAFHQTYNCLQNSNAFPVTATFYYGSYETPVTTATVVIPPYGLSFGPPPGFAVNGLGSLYMTLSAPIRMTVISAIDLEQPTLLPVLTASPPGQMTSLGQLGFSSSGNSSSVYSWTWQIGTAAPPPQLIEVFSSFPFTATVTGGAPAWLKVTPTSATGPASLTLQPIVTNLGAGTYTGAVVITQQLPPDLAQFGPSTATFPVASTASTQPTLVFGNNDDNADFKATPGGPAPAPISIGIESNGTPAAFTTSMTGGSWLTVTPSSGTTPATLTLTANPAGLAAGNYSIDLLVQGPINTEFIPVGLVITGGSSGALQVQPTSLSFTLAAGQGPPASAQTISLFSNLTPTVSVTTQSGGNWLIASVLVPQLVQVNATAANLGPGAYQGLITIATAANNQSAIVPVTLTVYPSGPSQFSISPSSLTLTTTAGSTAAATITVMPVSGSPLFTISQTSGPIGAFQINPPETMNSYIVAPATITFLTPAATPPGTYQASITFSWTGGSVTIPITIIVAASPTAPPTMTAIVASGSALPGSIAPGELISIFGSGLGAAPTSLQLTASGAVATILNGTQVLMNGNAVPLVYTSSDQVNAIVPYEVSGTATVQVTSNGLPTATWTVPVAPAAPSLFTASSSGVGQAAIVNADGTINSASNPAARGSIIQIYATGGGQTSPPSSTGAVAQSAAMLALPVTATIGGQPAQILYSGSAPGEIDGVVQINAVIPSNITPGPSVPITITINSIPSQSAVTLAIQ